MSGFANTAFLELGRGRGGVELEATNVSHMVYDRCGPRKCQHQCLILFEYLPGLCLLAQQAPRAAGCVFPQGVGGNVDCRRCSVTLVCSSH